MFIVSSSVLAFPPSSRQNCKQEIIRNFRVVCIVLDTLQRPNLVEFRCHVVFHSSMTNLKHLNAAALLFSASQSSLTTSACSVIAEHDWKDEGELAELAPVTVVGTATQIEQNVATKDDGDDYYYGPRRYTVEVTCVLTETDLVTVNSIINVTGFGDSAACSSEAPEDEPAIIFLDNNEDGTFSARYDDPHSAVAELSEDHLLEIADALQSPPNGGIVACGRQYYDGADFEVLFNATVSVAVLSTTSMLAVATATFAAFVAL